VDSEEVKVLLRGGRIQSRRWEEMVDAEAAKVLLRGGGPVLPLGPLAISPLLG
jgi:hypothetical protein